MGEFRGNENVANLLKQNWESAFSKVEVVVNTLPWSSYTQAVKQGNLPVWRMSWCEDYNDAYNFLNDGLETVLDGYGDWKNITGYTNYHNLLVQASQTSDGDTRVDLYRQAEQVLVQDNAVMLPVFYNGGMVAVRPGLQRPLDVGPGYIPDWHVNRSTQQAVNNPAAETQMSSSVDGVDYDFPAGTFSEPVTITHTALPPSSLQQTSELNARTSFNAFQISAVSLCYSGQAVSPQGTYTVTVSYTEKELKGIGVLNESSLALCYWDEIQQKWIKEPDSTLDKNSRTITARPARFATWTVMGDQYKFLPFTRQ